MRLGRYLPLALALLGSTAIAHAQGGFTGSGSGCAQSPENPTVILSMLGAGGFAAAAARDRLVGALRKFRRS